MEPDPKSTRELVARMQVLDTPDSEYVKKPCTVIPRGRDIETEPCLSWAARLAERRPELRPAVGIGLQHVARGTHRWSQVAVVDLASAYRFGELFVPWLAPLRSKLRAVRSTDQSPRGFGRTFGEVMSKLVPLAAHRATQVILAGTGGQLFGPILPLENVAHLRAVVRASVPRSDLAWLDRPLLCQPWVADAAATVLEEEVQEDAHLRTVLYWLAHAPDAARFLPLLETWAPRFAEGNDQRVFEQALTRARAAAGAAFEFDLD